MNSQPLVLVAEDDLTQGLALCDALQEAGFVVIGPFPTAADACSTLERLSKLPVIALLDAQLKDGTTVPITDYLSALGVPSLLVTDQLSQEVPEGLREAGGRLSRPLDMAELLGLTQALAAA